MANNCRYNIMAVSKNKESLERLFRIMDYKDKEYYLYRVFDVCWITSPVKFGSEYCLAELHGDVAWSAFRWIEDEPNLTDTSSRGAHYSVFPEICEALGIGVEIWTEESGIGFQEHYIVNHDGEVLVNGCVDWAEEYEDEDGKLHESTGGFDNYMEYSDIEDIY